MTMKSLKLLIFICLAICYANSVKCDEDDSVYYGETSMSNIDDANKEYEDELSPLPDSALVLEHEMVYEQSDQPVSGERFIAVRVDKMGATEKLKPNLVGLSNMAIQFLPRDYQLVEIVEATREIVSGVRYELLVGARDGKNEAVLCRIVVTEKTWVVTAMGDRQRYLDYTNCTSNGNANESEPGARDFRFNPLFVTSNANSINDDKLAESPIETEKGAQKPMTREFSDFDLRNLEAMILPSNAKPKHVPNLVKTKGANRSPNEVQTFDYELKPIEPPQTQTANDSPTPGTTSDFSDFDLKNLEAMIIPSNPRPKPTATTARTKLFSKTQNEVQFTETSETQTVDYELKMIESQIQADSSVPKAIDVSDSDLRNLEAMMLPANAKPQSVENTAQVKVLSKAQSERKVLSENMESKSVDGMPTAKPSDFSDFDLKNLEAMILPSNARPKHVENVDKTSGLPKSQNDVQVSETQIEQEHNISKSEVITETHSTDDVTVNTNVEISETDRPRIGGSATESGQQENILNEPRLDEITLKSESGDTEPSVVAVTVDSHSLNNEKLSDTKVNDNDATSQMLVNRDTNSTSSESLVEGSHNVRIENVIASAASEEITEQSQPKIEAVSLQMEDSVVPSSEAAVIYEKLAVEDEVISEATDNDDNREIVRSKREIHTEMQFLKKLTNEALQQLDYVDADNLKRIALDIIRVKRIEQENGAIYVIKVRTANSDCGEDESDDEQTCLDNVILDSTKICFIEVKSKRDVNTVSKSECGPDKNFVRSRRDEAVLGAPVNTDPSEDDKIKQLVTTALAELNEKPDSRKYSLHRIKSSQKQVVAGILYKVDAEFALPNNEIKDCYIELAVREWLKPEPDILKLDCGEDDEVTRSKRSLFYDPRRSPENEQTEYERNIALMFDQFKETYNKKYESAMEHATRLRIFQHNLHIINELNRLEMGTATYGLSEFADFTQQEYKQKAGLWRRTLNNEIPLPIADIPDIDLPKSFDWREKGAVSEVKNQGNCGSCWAFSVIGNIEGLNAIKTGKLEEFSEQELVDCDTVDSGCNGGLPDNAYKAIEQIGGLEYESEYPYEAKKSKCHFDKSLAHVKVSGAVDLPKNETAMALYLVENGPLSIGINANAMQFYRGGISHPPRILCRHSGIDHGVLIVGYGVAEYPVFNKTLPYWIVKNSWGPSWGEKGYYRVFRGADTCGLSSMVSSAVLD